MVDDLKVMYQAVQSYGVYGILLILLILFVHDPSRAEKLKVVVLAPFYRWWRWGSRQYLATKVGLSVSESYKHQINAVLSSAFKVKFKIRWVNTVSDPVLKKNGTLILKLEETDDQTRNILSATKVALSKTVCPTLRSQIHPYVENAIDLALLRKLTERLGKHAHPIFLKHFLEPQTKDDAECAELLTELLEIDQAGLFVAIFLEELTLLGDYAFSRNDREDKTDSIRKLLDFLLVVARREEFEEIELNHVSNDFQIGIMLLAKTFRVTREGVTPYVKRLNRNIREGCDSLYIIAFKPALSFHKKVVRAIRNDIRILVAKEVPRIAVKSEQGTFRNSISIVQLRVGQGFADLDFEDQLKEWGISEGDTVQGKVIDVAESVALVSVQGLTGCITRLECDWSTVGNCADILTVGDNYDFKVARFDGTRGMLVLTRRFEEDDPFVTMAIPSVGDVIAVKIVGVDSVSLISQREDGFEIQIPFSEVSWMSERPENPRDLLSRRVTVGIYEVDVARHLVRGSLRRLEQNPWQAIHERFPKGAQIRGTVIEVNQLLHFVRVQIADGIIGILPAESLIAAGYEYSDFENTLLIGQTLDVVVTKVFINKRRVRLDLQRNITHLLANREGKGNGNPSRTT